MVTKNEIKFVQSLHRKKYRQKYSQFIVEGTKSVVELINSSYQVNHIYASKEWLNEHVDQLKSIKQTEASLADLERLSFFKSASPVVAVAEMPQEEIPATSDQWILALDGISDPGNLGTIIRIADWYGIKHIICSDDTVDQFNPKTISSTMGSFTRVMFHYTDLKEYIQQTNQEVYFTLMQGADVKTINPKQPGIIVIGSEANGISDEVLQLPHTAVTIPKNGQAESLNAAVATGIICDRLIA